MATPDLRVAMVGYGYFAEFHLKAWQRLTGATLQALTDAKPDRRSAALAATPQIAVFETIDDMLSSGEFDILDVATPPATHLDLVRSALGRVRAIICQKPFCESLTQAQQLAAASAESATQLVVHENFRFQPWYREIQRILQDGQLGRVVQAQFRLRPGDGAASDAYLDRQPYFRDVKQFLIRETGVHWIDVFRFLFGDPVALSADLFRTNPVIAGEDSGTFTFQMADGARIVFDGNRTLDHVAENKRLTMGEFLIEGREASLHLSGNGIIQIRKFGENVWHPHVYSFEDRDFGGDCVYHLQKHVVEHLRTGQALENTATSYLKNLELQSQIYSAADTGMKVTLGAGESVQ
ncbi:MAG: Gfo/Idh/MocA family oxidoreductase [Hyphomicrobiales bacterium]